MTSVTKRPRASSAAAFADRVGTQAERKLRARRRRHHNVWHGLGMMGIIGWSIVVPSVGGTALGIWLDARYPGGRSWTLALLGAGIFIGCFAAWRWVAQEHHSIRKEEKHDDE